MNEIDEIDNFVTAYKRGDYSDTIPSLEEGQRLAIGYGQRIGELCADATKAHTLRYAESLERLSTFEDGETETTRKAKLAAWCADEKHALDQLKNLYVTLKSIRMGLSQAIKTRREEPR